VFSAALLRSAECATDRPRRSWQGRSARGILESRPPPGNTQFLERIVIGRNHNVAPANHVNPLYILELEQIHRVGKSPKAIPVDPDLL